MTSEFSKEFKKMLMQDLEQCLVLIGSLPNQLRSENIEYREIIKIQNTYLDQIEKKSSGKERKRILEEIVSIQPFRATTYLALLPFAKGHRKRKDLLQRALFANHVLFNKRVGKSFEQYNTLLRNTFVAQYILQMNELSSFQEFIKSLTPFTYDQESAHNVIRDPSISMASVLEKNLVLYKALDHFFYIGHCSYHDINLYGWSSHICENYGTMIEAFNALPSPDPLYRRLGARLYRFAGLAFDLQGQISRVMHLDKPIPEYISYMEKSYSMDTFDTSFGVISYIMELYLYQDRKEEAVAIAHETILAGNTDRELTEFVTTAEKNLGPSIPYLKPFRS